MIKYELLCKSCKISFSSWFASSKEYEKLKKLRHISCHICNSLNVEKCLMSPSVATSKKDYEEIKSKKKNINFKNELKLYQRFIKKNFKYVGENFAYEARSIHYLNKKNTKGIYGKATNKEIKELKEEGIKTEFLTWIEKKDN